MTTLLIAYALNVLDYFITAYWVSLYGAEIEANPFMRWAFENDIAWAVKILAVGGLFGLIGYFIKRKPKTAWAAYELLAIYAVIVLQHIALVVYVGSL